MPIAAAAFGTGNPTFALRKAPSKLCSSKIRIAN
jgi:hypothetical protein